MKKTILIFLAIIIMLPSCVELPPTGHPSASMPQDGAVSIGSIGNDTTVTEETVYIPFKDRYFEEWHLSDMENWDARVLGYSDAAEYNTTNGIYVKLPYVVYEEDLGELHVKVEFFKDTYTYHSLIQARVTVTNHTGIRVRYDCREPYANGVFLADDGRYVYFDASINGVNPGIDDRRYALLEDGESFVNEGVYPINEYTFDPNKEYVYKLEISLTKVEDRTDYKTFSCSFPIEVCAPNAE